MMRRPMWLIAGAALGAGGTLWTRRRLERLAQRVRPSVVAGDVATVVDRRRRLAALRVRDAFEAGRAGAQRRELDLRDEMAARNASRNRAVPRPDNGRAVR